MPIPALEPRKKPAQARSAATVGVILEAAARILESRGFDGYTTNAVAEVAGVSVGSLYQYFPGKDALTAALIERETAVLLCDLEALDAIDDGLTALHTLLAACAAHQMRRPALARVLDFEEQRLPLHEQQEGTSARLMHTIRAILAKLPTPPPDDPETSAADILAMAKGMVDAAGERGETDVAHLEARVTRAVFGYLGIALG